jgi:Cytochrome C and Quinol oxidase polypeptide I
VGSSTNCDAGDDASSRDIEQKHLTVREGDEAKLPIAGDGDRLRRTTQVENPRWFPRHHTGIRRDRIEDIQLVVLPIRHIDLAGVGIIIHWAKLPSTEQGSDNLPRIQVNSNEATLASGHIGGKTARDADTLWSISNRYRAKQVSVHLEDRERSGSADPELIGSRGSGIRRGRGGYRQTIDGFTSLEGPLDCIGSMVFGFFAGVYYWFPKMLGRRLNTMLGQLHFWLFEIGFLGTFLALFYAGLLGEARWLANIPPPFAVPNLIASLFVILVAASVFTFIYNAVITLISGERATANEWGAKTLEWTVPTPVPLENFEHLPVVTSLPYDYGSPVPAGGDGIPATDGAVAGAPLQTQPQVES